MKRIIALLLATVLCLSLTGALAEIPEEKKPVETELDGGVIASMHYYNTKLYEVPCEQPGTIERVDYTTDVFGTGTLDRWATVYLPYGYDESKQYNIIYFYHGANETQNSFIGEDIVKNAFDNMIYYGVCDPFIMVCPTFYYDYEARASKNTVLPDEIRLDLMPAVESKYSTYAETADDAGFIASREHRCFSGYSGGSSACWAITFRMFDYAKWFMPVSGGNPDHLPALKQAMEKYPEYADDVFVILCTGGKRDVAYTATVALANKMLGDPAFSFGTDPQENNFYVEISKEIHQTLKARLNIYSAFVDVLFK